MTDTAEDRALSAIRRAIVDGRYPPGARLTVAQLARDLALSPMPVRAALRHLAGEGLVEADAHRGARVRALSPADIRNLYRLRGAVLGLLVPDVARNVSDADLDALETIEAQFENAARRGDTRAAMAANEAFHAALLTHARNPDAASVMARSWALVEATRLRLGFGPGRLSRSVESHRALLTALRARDGRGAAGLMVASSENAMADLLERALSPPRPAVRARSAARR